jgi:two-component system, NarL family, sensor kinase
VDQPQAPAASQTPEAAGSRPEPDDAPWVVLTHSRPPAPTPPPLSARRVVLQLLVAVAVVLVVVGALGSFAAQRLAEREAVNDAAGTADVLAEAVITPVLRDALLAGDALAVGAVDTVVRDRVIGEQVVRVKLWAPDGTVVYADEPQLVGRRFALSANQRQALAQPRTTAEVSDLSESENEFEQGSRLLEVYRPVWTPGGRELLFETYTAYDTVTARADQLWRGFAGVTVSSMLLLVLLMAPVLARLLRRLQEAQRQRERLLERTVEASDAERRRIAGTLHDGPVQELVATSFAAAGAAERAGAHGYAALAGELRTLASAVRANVGVLRSLLVDIYPPSLARAGLASALADLAASTAGRGVEVDLDLAAGLGLARDEERLVYRVTQETLRNAAAHAAPCQAKVRLRREGGQVVLEVGDDGPGFSPSAIASPREGHLGLRVLVDLAADAGAELAVASAPGRGTRWRLALTPAAVPA